MYTNAYGIELVGDEDDRHCWQRLMTKRITTLVFNSFNSRYTAYPYAHLLFKQHYKTFGKFPEKYTWVDPKYFIQDVVPQTVADWLTEQKIDIVIASMYFWNYNFTHEILRLFKKQNPNAIVLAGGPNVHNETNPNYFNDYPWIDYVCSQKVYGEAFLTDFLDGNNIEECRGAVWNGGQSSKPFSIREYEWAPGVYSDNLDIISGAVEKYKSADVKFVAMFETTRGCPFKCTYCEWGGGIGGKMVKKSFEESKREITALAKAKVHQVTICDSNFGFWDEDVELIKHFALCNKIIGYPKAVELSGWAKNNYKNHYEIAKAWKQSKLQDMFYYVHIQSVSEHTLINIKRPDAGDSYQKWELGKKIKELGVEVRLEIILSLPGDKLLDYYKILDKRNELDAFTSHIWILLPGTEAYTEEYRKQFGLVTNKAHQWIPDHTLLADLEKPVHRELQGVYDTNNIFEYVIGSYSLTPEDFLEVYLLDKFYNAAKAIDHIWEVVENKREQLKLKPSLFWRKFMRNYNKVTNLDWITFWNELYPKIHKLIEPLEPGEHRQLGYFELDDGTKLHNTQISNKFFEYNLDEILVLIENDKQGLK